MVKRSTLTKKIKILDYKWVYIYKFNKYNRFCNKIPPEVTCRVTCGVRIQRD